MKHFLDINQLDSSSVQQLLSRASLFKSSRLAYPSLADQRLANLFYENSTRTRISFELAAAHLGMPVVNFTRDSSSEGKGESFEDTLRTLAVMGINILVIRHSENGLQQQMAQKLEDLNLVHIINAGDGTGSHPSQAMLDLMTILEVKPDLSKLKIAIVGDIRHSRVANSLMQLFAILGVGALHWVAPKRWWPLDPCVGHCTESLTDGIENADVVICLRVQRERLLATENIDFETYRKNYALTLERLRFAAPEAMVMHPGPMNRGVEIDSVVADGAQSFVLKQVQNGVYMRMAIIEALVTGLSC